MTKMSSKKRCQKKHEMLMDLGCEMGGFGMLKPSKTMPCAMNSRFAAFTKFHEK